MRGTAAEPQDWAVDWLSKPRLATYVAAAGPSGALERYAWNCCASTALFELIGWFEVAWRNSIDRAICARRGEDAPHWLFDRSFPLRPTTWAKVDAAVRTVRCRVKRRRQFIAELTLGFWRMRPGRRSRRRWIGSSTGSSSCATGSRIADRGRAGAQRSAVS
ncbi:MAG TPA: hypothetical protein VGG05_01670 [Pseudonocardiaceae bacterium]|jgi:hypothetical protein